MTDVAAPAPPEVYRLSMEKVPLAVARAWRVAVLQVLLGTTAVLAGFTFALRGSGSTTDVGLVLWGFAVVLLPYAAWRAGRRVRRHWNAFELSIGAETLRCAAKGSGRIVIKHTEIAELVEGSGGLLVRSSRPGVVVRIPKTVEGYIDVRARLAVGRSIATSPDALLWCLALVGAGLAAAVTASSWSRVPCVAAGVLLSQVAAAVVADGEIRRHPRLSRGSKMRSLLVVALAAALPVLALARALRP
jgi:hypothetical protein